MCLISTCSHPGIAGWHGEFEARHSIPIVAWVGFWLADIQAEVEAAAGLVGAHQHAIRALEDLHRLAIVGQ